MVTCTGQLTWTSSLWGEEKQSVVTSREASATTDSEQMPSDPLQCLPSPASSAVHSSAPAQPDPMKDQKGTKRALLTFSSSPDKHSYPLASQTGLFILEGWRWIYSRATLYRGLGRTQFGGPWESRLGQDGARPGRCSSGPLPGSPSGR